MTKRVAFVAPLPPPVHGFSNICAAMLDHLKARAVVSVFDRAPRIDGSLAARLRPLVNLVRFCLWCVKNTNADLYIGLSGGLGQIADLPYIVIGRCFRHRVFIHHHSFAYINAPSVLNKFLFALLRDQWHIVLSERMGGELVHIYRLNSSRVKIVSNAAFFESGTEPTRSSEKGGPISLGYLSAVSFEKGIGEFFAVIAELKRLGIAYRGWIAGPVAPAAQAQFAQWLAASSDVTYSGAIYGDAKAAFYRNLDVLLFPTGYANEAEPLVIHEAMRSGVHVIACERGAIAEMLSHGAGIVCLKPSFVATAVDCIRKFTLDTGSLRLAQQLSLEQARAMHDSGAAELGSLLDEMAGAAGVWRERAKGSLGITVAVFAVTFALTVCKAAFGDIVNHDTLDRALMPADIPVGQDLVNSINLLAAGKATYDSNVFRLPSSGVDVAALAGPNASRADHIYSPSAGLNGQWTVGRQFVTLDVDVDENRFARNTNLNNVSSSDALKWNWALGSQFSGQMGVDFRRFLGSFYNTGNYRRDIVSLTEYFAGGRYAVGPHVALFGGVLYTDASLSQPALKVNDNKQKAVDFGMEYALGVASSLGVDYRYTDARYGHTAVLNGVPFNPDYRDEMGRVTFKDTLSEKTQIEATLGYLRRNYPSAAIGSFSGNIWRLSFDWRPTEKTELLAVASQNLQADLTTQTDYFVSKAVTVSPTWIASEKVKLTLTLGRDDQNYIGSNSFVTSLVNRRDLVNSAQINVGYSPLISTPAHGLSFNFSFRREHRSSNQAALSYNDSISTAGFVFKF
jgi:glycosyltransferase involved in cell wall biosynthesis